MSKKPKITIKPFRHQVQMDPNYAENTWKLLKVFASEEIQHTSTNEIFHSGSHLWDSQTKCQRAQLWRALQVRQGLVSLTF